MTVLLEAVGLTVGYRRGRRRHTVLAGVDAALRGGELVCLLGPNGAGKSTLLRTLAGLLPPLAGHVELRGRDLARSTAAEIARQVGVVLPERLQIGMLSAFELVTLGRLPYTGWSGKLRPRDEQSAHEAMRRVGVDALAQRDVDTLSDGERQKVMIARALAQEPALLVLDEPTAFLDLPGRVEIMGLLRRLAHGRRGEMTHAVLLSTHDLDLALRTADRVWLLGAGDGVVSGAPEDLVLSGAVADAFPSPEASFDARSGSFRVEPHPSATVTLEGAGLTALWTRRGLERAGFRVAEDAAHVPRIVVIEDRRRRWRLSIDGETVEHPSIADLVNDLRSRLRPADEEDSL